MRATDSSGSTSTVNGSVAGGEFLRNVLSGPIRLVVDPIVLHFNLDDFSALNRSHSRRRIVGIESERAISAAQIGRAHAGKRLALGR